MSRASGKSNSASAAAAWTLGAILPWATMAAVVESALKTITSPQLLFWSFLFATPASFAWDRCFSGRKIVDLFHLSWQVGLIGLIGIFGWTTGVFLSLDHAPVIEANLLTYLWPLMMVAMSPMAGERFSSISLIGALIGFIGAALIVSGGTGISIKPQYLVGYGLALAGALAWATFVILLRRQGQSGTRRTPVFVLGALLCSFFLALGIDGHIIFPPLRILAASAWLGVGPMALAFVCWDRAVNGHHLGLVGRLSYFDPLISTLLLITFLGLLPTTAVWLGMVLIIAGVALPELWSVWVSKTHQRSGKPSLQKLD